MKKKNKVEKTVEKKQEVAVKAPKKANPYLKTVSYVMLIIIALISIFVMSSTFIPKNFNIGLEAPTYIKIYNEDSNVKTYYEDTEVYKEVLNLYNESFKSTAMIALLNGKLAKGVSIEEGYKNISSSSLSSATYIEFRYDEAQTVKLNGEKYTTSSSAYSSYRSVIIEVKDTDSLTQINAYVRYREDGTSNDSYVRYVTYATQSNLYDYIKAM